MRFFFSILILLVASPSFGGGFELSPEAERKSVADFELKDIDGKKVRLSDHRGKVVVVSFWATWCEPCKQELGFLNQYYRELKDKGFEVIAVSTDAPETQAEVKAVTLQKGWEFKVLLDGAGEVSALLNPRGATPYSMFLDRNGNLSYDHEGYTVGDEVHYKPLVEALLGESYSTTDSASSGALNFTNTFSFLAYGDNGDDVVDDDYFLGVNRLNITGGAGDFSVWARFDTWKFWNRPQVLVQGKNPYRKHYELDRLNFRFENDGIELISGDYFLQLGRGIALSLRKSDEVSLETVLRGGKLSVSGDDYKVGTFAGRLSNSNLDPISNHTMPEFGDELGGVFLEYSGIGGVLVGAHGFHRIYETPVLPGDQDWSQTGGLYLDIPSVLDWAAFYVEVNMQRRYQVGIFNNALGGVAASTLSFGDTNLLVEGAYLDDFEMSTSFEGLADQYPKVPLNRPPTLSRIRDEVITLGDYVGGRVRLEHSFREAGLLVHANGRYRNNLPNSASPIVEYHGFGGFELSFQGGKSKVSMEGGYRIDQQEKNDSLSPVRDLTHFYLSYIQAIRSSFSLSFSSDTEYKGYEVVGEEELANYWYGSTFLGINKSNLGALTFEFGYDTKRDDTRSFFYAGIAKWNMTQSSELRATVGSQRGGLKCVNGICREYPAFAGGKLEVISRF